MVLWSLGLLVPLCAQNEGVDPKAVERAIAEGVGFLRETDSPGYHRQISDADELVLWTFVHAGVKSGDEKFRALFRKMIEGKLERTYKVALQAMILEEIDRVKYQWRIAQCAQFLIDNQCRNGQWSYGEPTPALGDLPTGDASMPDVASSETAPRAKPPVRRQVRIRATRSGPVSGDNSNSQYAALGLRACHDAGISLPEDGIRRAREWWAKSQLPDEEKGKGSYGAIRGWTYGKPSQTEAWGSMTAGGIGAVILYDHLLKTDPRKDRLVQDGMRWMIAHFTVKENPGRGERWHFY